MHSLVQHHIFVGAVISSPVAFARLGINQSILCHSDVCTSKHTHVAASSWLMFFSGYPFWGGVEGKPKGTTDFGASPILAPDVPQTSSGDFFSVHVFERFPSTKGHTMGVHVKWGPAMDIEIRWRFEFTNHLRGVFLFYFPRQWFRFLMASPNFPCHAELWSEVGGAQLRSLGSCGALCPKPRCAPAPCVPFRVAPSSCTEWGKPRSA